MEIENIKCPNCNYSKEVPTSNLPKETKRIKCPSCNEFFSYTPRKNNQVFKSSKEVPKNAAGIVESELSITTKINLFIATVILATSLLPIGAIFSHFAKGMYGPIFKGISPAIYLIANIATSYTFAAILVLIIFKKTNLFDRIKRNFLSPVLFCIGNTIFILYLAIRVFASSIEGGGTSMAVSVLGQYPLSIAKACLGIAFIRLLIGIEVESALKRCLTHKD